MSRIAVLSVEIDNNIFVGSAVHDGSLSCSQGYAFLTLRDAPAALSVDGRLMVRVALESHVVVWRYCDGAVDRELEFTHADQESSGAIICLGDMVSVIHGFSVPGVATSQKYIGIVDEISVFV